MTRAGPTSREGEPVRQRRRWMRLLSGFGCAALLAIAIGSEIPQADTFLVASFAALMLLVHLSGEATSRRAEEELRRAKDRTEAFLDTLPDAAWMKDREGRYLTVNETFARRAGRSPEQIIGRTDFDLLPLSTARRLAEDDRRAIASGSRIVLLERDPTDPEERRWLETVKAPFRELDGTVTGTIGIAHDITEHREVAEAREHTLSVLQATLESTADALLVVDNDGRVVSFNGRFVEMWGSDPRTLESEEGLGGMESLLDRIADRVEFGERIQRILARPETASRDELTLVDGRIIERYSRPQRIGSRIVGRVWGFRDVTDERRALAALQRRDAILEAVSFAAERFLRTSQWDSDLREALERIGGAASASRAYLFEISDGQGATVVSQRAEWSAAGIPAQLDNPELQNLRLGAVGLERWEAMLRRNEPVQERVADLPPEERAHLEGQGIQSILLFPISVRGVWWGFLGFDDCVRAREWSSAEREVLGAAAGMIGAAIERKRNEEALRESELRFKQLSDNIPEVFFMTSVDMSEVLFLSPSFERVWGRTLAEAHENPLLFVESILPEDRPILFADMELSRSGKGDSTRQVDYRISRPDGSIAWIRNRIFQIPDGAGNPYRVAGVCTDVTEQKKLEEELRRASRLEAIGHLAAGIAHEINTPIQYIGDNVRFLDESYGDVRSSLELFRALLREASGGPVPPQRLVQIEAELRRADIDYLIDEAPRATTQALEGIRRVTEIVRAMKEFSHPGTGQKVPTDLNQAIRSTTTVARNEWRYVAELVTSLDPSLPPVHCFAGEVNQAILNLVVNAAHAIADAPRRGKGETGVIGISTALRGDHVEIRVSDTGTGIPLEIQQRIFDPFFTTKEVGRGTGQGLTFVHATVVEKHGGTITFETEQGVGTTFVVRLPHGSGAPGLEEAA